MNLHDKQYFNNLVSNIILWTMIIILIIVLVLFVSLPVILAMEFHKAWLALYAAYAAAFLLFGIIAAQKKED